MTIHERFEKCFVHIVRHEVRVRQVYEWVIKTRPDVYFHCVLQSFQTFHVAAGWDYFVAVRRIYAAYLFANEACKYHPAICNVCRVQRVFVNSSFVPIFHIVDLARSCQLHKRELQKHKCQNVSYTYASMTNNTCPQFTPQGVSSLWSTLSKCIKYNK